MQVLRNHNRGACVRVQEESIVEAEGGGNVGGVQSGSAGHSDSSILEPLLCWKQTGIQGISQKKMCR